MVWTENHDTLLLREILAAQPWTHRHGSVERGQCWDGISMILCTIEEPLFKVSTRSVRDRYALLVKKYKTRRNAEAKASGISPEHTEIDDALQDLLERFEEADSARKTEKTEKVGKELAAAQDIRNASLETFSETRKRNGNDTSSSDNKRRRSSSDMLTFLSEKSERDHALKQEELHLKQKEMELHKQQLETCMQNQNAQLIMMQQQNTAVLELLKSFQK